MVWLWLVLGLMGCKRWSGGGGNGAVRGEGVGGGDSIGVAEKEASQEEVYDSIVIGGEVWMRRNLDVSCFRNGEEIGEARSAEEWRRAWKERRPAWCYYNNDSLMGRRYGKLYNWYAVIDSRGLAPEGWKIPSVDDYKKLAGSPFSFALDCMELGQLSGEPDVSSGQGVNGKVRSLLGGARYASGEFDYLGISGDFWCRDSVPERYKVRKADMGWSVSVAPDNFCGIDPAHAGCGFYVRCIRDKGSKVERK